MAQDIAEVDHVNSKECTRATGVDRFLSVVFEIVAKSLRARLPK